MFVDEKHVFVDERHVFVDETHVFVDEKHVFVDEKHVFVDETHNFIVKASSSVTGLKYCISKLLWGGHPARPSVAGKIPAPQENLLQHFSLVSSLHLSLTQAYCST
ncbi:hypothetical protein NIES25_24340 [Nostoc linckia NIES-25]|nr:hypothetical protein NIES25_24340 [Nostoc linckia NIES-25]